MEVCVLVCAQALSIMLVFMYIMFVWAISSQTIIFNIYRDVTITGEGMQLLTYSQHSWHLSNNGFKRATPTSNVSQDMH